METILGTGRGWAEIIGASPAGVVAKPVAQVVAPNSALARIKSELKPVGLGAGAVGALAGYKFLKGGSKWLAALAGFAAGSGAYDLATGNKSEGLAKLAGAAGAVLGGKKLRKHSLVGFLGGGVAGSAAGFYVGKKL